VGDRYDPGSNKFTPGVTLAVTSIEPIDVEEGYHSSTQNIKSATIPLHSGIRVGFELRNINNTRTLKNMDILAMLYSDSRHSCPIMIPIIQGLASIEWYPNDSGIWKLTSKGVNSGLTPPNLLVFGSIPSSSKEHLLLEIDVYDNGIVL